MIWNDQILFLHPQKTAGMAITSVLLKVLRKPLFNSLPLTHLPSVHERGVAYVPGIRHENMYQAREILKGFGLKLDDFKYIVVAMRNPYDMEVSRYFHLRKPEAFERNTERKLALKYDFGRFSIKSEFRTKRPYNENLTFNEAIKNYYSLGAEIPNNLRILKFESLTNDLNLLLGDLDYPEVELSKVNVSNKRGKAKYIDLITSGAVEESIFLKYEWIFQHGFYSRLKMI